MSTSGGKNLANGLTFATHATGDTVGANTYNRVTSGGAGAINLPANPPVGTQVAVESNQTIPGSGAVTVTPAGASLIEGSAGLNLNSGVDSYGARCWLTYDGTNWSILDVDPDVFAVQIAPGGVSLPSSPFRGTTLMLPRQCDNAAFTISSGVPLTLAAAPTNIDISIVTPGFSAGQMKLRYLSIGLSDAPVNIAAPTQRLILTLPAGDLGTLAPGSTYFPTAGVIAGGTANFVGFGSWTTTSSIGADLAIHAGGASIDSTAGGSYWWYATLNISCEALVP